MVTSPPDDDSVEFPLVDAPREGKRIGINLTYRECYLAAVDTQLEAERRGPRWVTNRRNLRAYAAKRRSQPAAA